MSAPAWWHGRTITRWIPAFRISAFRILAFWILALSVTWMVGAAPAFAQLPDVAPEWYSDVRRLKGDRLTFCWWEGDTAKAIHRAVGQELADLLLLEVSFHEVPGTYLDIMGEESFWERVFLALVEDCDAFMGFRLREGLPDWLRPSRSYYRAGALLAVTDAEIRNLADMPAGRWVGSKLAGIADAHVIVYAGNLPADRRWRRLPYDSDETMLEHLRDGFLSGAVMWAPTLYHLTEGDPEGYGVYVRPLDPVAAVEVDVGIVVRSRDVYLRNVLDQAIDAAIRDGIIQDVLDSLGYPGKPGALR